MKYRSSFITNSSSSSYTCDICGETYSGWDLGLSEAEMFECENGHTFCESHDKNNILYHLIEKLEESGETTYKTKSGNEIYTEELRYECPEEFCPVCNFEKILDEDFVNYLIKFHNIDRNEIENEIRQKFSSYVDFVKAIQQNDQ